MGESSSRRASALPLDDNPDADESAHLFTAQRTPFILVTNMAFSDGGDELSSFSRAERNSPSATNVAAAWIFCSGVSDLRERNHVKQIRRRPPRTWRVANRTSGVA